MATIGPVTSRRTIQITAPQIETLNIQAIRTPVGLQMQAPQLLTAIERYPTDVDPLDLQRHWQVEIRQGERFSVGGRFGWGKIENDVTGSQFIDTQSAFEQADRRPGKTRLLHLDTVTALLP